MKKRRPAAVSLVEILVASGLFVLLGGLVLTFFVGLMRSSLRGMAKGAAEQQTVLIFQRWLHDLQGTTSAAISWEPDVPPTHCRALCIQPVESVSNEGRLVYADARLVCYFWDGSTHVLRRKEWNVPPAVSLDRNIPRRLSAAQLNALRIDSLGTVNVYERVDDFDLGNPLDSPNIGSPLKPTLLCRIETVQGANANVDRYRMTRAVILRNTQMNAAPPFP